MIKRKMGESIRKTMTKICRVYIKERLFYKNKNTKLKRVRFELTQVKPIDLQSSAIDPSAIFPKKY